MTRMNLINNCFFSLSLSLLVYLVSAHFVCIILMRFSLERQFLWATLNVATSRVAGRRVMSAIVALILITTFQIKWPDSRLPIPPKHYAYDM